MTSAYKNRGRNSGRLRETMLYGVSSVCQGATATTSSIGLAQVHGSYIAKWPLPLYCACLQIHVCRNVGGHHKHITHQLASLVAMQIAVRVRACLDYLRIRTTSPKAVLCTSLSTSFVTICRTGKWAVYIIM